jgi:hypothetical protein
VIRCTMLVTSDGEWVPEDSDDLLAAIGDPEPDYHATLFAVKNLGFIKYQVLEGSIVEIELHPRNVELAALLAVQQQLLTSPVKLFRIRYFDTDWHSELLPSAEHTIARLSELCSPAPAPPHSERFLVEPQDYSKLFVGEETPLRLLVQKWRVSFGHFDPSVISFSIKHQLLARMVIVGVKPRQDEPVFRFIGDGHGNWLDTAEHVHAIGEKLANMPDKDYGGWASEYYKSVARSGEPRYDYVTASILRRPEIFVTRYERLLLPWKTGSDEIFVTLWSRGLNGDAKAVKSSSASASATPAPASSTVMKLARSS